MALTMIKQIITTITIGLYNLIINYIKSSYQNDPFRVFLEGFLFLFAVWYLGSMAYRPNVEVIKLSKKEIDELCEEWEPEPLVPLNTPIVDDPPRDDKLTFCSGTDFLGLRKLSDIRDVAKSTVREYGVGTCGPAGFYGTLDVHLELQEKLAKALGTEAALVLAQGYSAVAGVIPAFAKRNDIIVADDGVNFAVQRGIALSRSKISWYKHNDIEDLETLLSNIQKREVGKILTRRFIITEGLFSNSGDIAMLPQIVKLAEKFKYRIILDDSMAFGTIGLGTCNYYNIDAGNLITVASLSNALGSAGGFTAGTKNIIDHQILSNQAYCYSASLPAIFATTAIHALGLLESLASELKVKVKRFEESYHKHARNLSLKGYVIVGHTDSPLRFLQSSNPEQQKSLESEKMVEIIQKMKAKGYLLSKRVMAEADELKPNRPAIKITVTLTTDIDSFFDALVSSL